MGQQAENNESPLILDSCSDVLGGRLYQQVIAALGRMNKPSAKGGVETLTCSLSRLSGGRRRWLSPAKALSAIGEEDRPCADLRAAFAERNARCTNPEGSWGAVCLVDLMSTTFLVDHDPR